MTYDFDTPINRKDTDCVKYDLTKKVYGTDDLIPLWVADMDFRAPREVEEALKTRASYPIYGYTLQTEDFFGAAQQWLEKNHNWKPGQEAMQCVPGVVPALSVLVSTFTDPGDEVIIQPPVYFPFYHVIDGNGREILRNPLKMSGGDFEMDFENLESQITPRTKMILLCNPHNPGGKMWSRQTLERLAEICERHNILIVTDEIHMDLSLCDKKHIPMASISKAAAGRTITCMSPAKSFNVAGLGAAITIVEHPELREKFKKALEVSHLFIGNIFGTVGLSAAYKYGGPWLAEVRTYLKENLDLMEEFMKNKIPRVRLIRPEATFLALLDCRELSLDDEELYHFMTNKAKLALNRGSQFGSEGEGFMRLNFATSRENLRTALGQLEKAVNEL